MVSGVFTINTKNHSGQRVWVMDRNVLVAGQRSDHVRNGAFEASRVGKLLGEVLGWPVHVRSIVAVVDPARLDVKQQPAGVEVLEARKLVRSLKKRRPVLSDEELARIERVMGAAATWRYQPDGEADLDRRQAFKNLQSAIRQAKRRRVMWTTGVVGAVVVLILIVVTQLT